MDKFFSVKLNDWIVDAMCVCGKPQSKHVNITMIIGEDIVVDKNHGDCSSTGCNKFTWNRWITETELLPEPMAQSA